MSKERINTESQDHLKNLEAKLEAGIDPVTLYRDLVGMQMRGGYIAEDQIAKGEDPTQILQTLELNGSAINLVGNFIRKKLQS